MSPWNMKNSCRKLEANGNSQIILADRGTFFGYNMLVNDMTCFPIMASTGYPVCFDATHSIQLPTSMGNISGGQREFIPHLVRAAVANGINLLFMEVHDDPDNALSDANTVLDIKYLENILIQAKVMHETRLELLAKYGPDNIHPKNNSMLVNEVMLPLIKFPVIAETVIMKEALEEMNRLRLGIACIVDSNHKLLGILTDGDIRRKLLKVQKPLSAFFVDDALDHAIVSPVTTDPKDTLTHVLCVDT
eukprot:Opistho-1_new@78795